MTPLKNQLLVHRWNLIHRRQHVKIRVDQFTAPTECEIEISPSASQDECSEQRGIDERAGVWGQEASAPTSPCGPRCNLYISSAHKGEARRSQQALTELTCPSHDCQYDSPLLDWKNQTEFQMHELLRYTRTYFQVTWIKFV